MSTLLFYSRPYETDFDAKVRAVEESKKGYRVVLDQTLFYPEGGGQPADIGWIADIPVTHVEKRDGRVWHYLKKAPPEGEVHCRIDWEHRFDYMQQHTGQHILSAVMYRDFGYNTVAIHQGEETTTIEIDTENIEEETIAAIEKRAMDIVSRNLPMDTNWVKDDEVDKYDLRRDPKVSGDIRLVTIEGYDTVACGGVHTATTGEVQLIKHVQTEKIRGRIRLYWKIGLRAFADYSLKNKIVAQLVDRFSAQAPELLERIDASMQETNEYRRRMNSLESKLAAKYARELFREASGRDGSHDPGGPQGPDGSHEQGGRSSRGGGSSAAGKTGDKSSGQFSEPVLMTARFEEDGKDFLKKVVEALSSEPSQQTWAFCGVNEGEERFQWIIAASEGLDFDFNARKKELLSHIEGKGGGRPPVWQGIGTKKEGIERFFQAFKSSF